MNVDNGEEFLYTGSGGRVLGGNRRTNVQSFDKELTKGNRGLAMNCNAPSMRTVMRPRTGKLVNLSE